MNTNETYKTVTEGCDPRNGIVAIFFGSHDGQATEGFWVEAHRTDFESDYVSEAEAKELYEKHINNSQTFA